MFRPIVVALAALVVFIVAAGPAGASTLTRSGTTLTYTAAAGVANDVLVVANSSVSPATFQISTANDPVTGPLPSDCQDPDLEPPVTSVQCTAVTNAKVQLGDQDDTATANLVGFQVAVELSGGEGKDTLTGSGSRQVLDGGPGNDTLSGGPGSDELRGGAGDDVLNGGEDGDYMTGDSGVDTVNGDGGDDTIYDGAGNDTVNGGDGPDNIYGVVGADTMRGDGGDDFVSGGYDDVPDTVEGGAGNDALEGVPGSVVDGGAGSNTYVLNPQASDEEEGMTATVDLAAGTSTLGDRQGPIRSVRDFSMGRNVGAGHTQSDYSNPVTVLGSAGPNAIFTAAGNDTVNPREGADVVNVQAGDDTVDAVDGFPDRVICGDGNDTVTADPFDTLEDCENVTTRDVGSVHDVPEDRAPAVTITAPSASAVLSTTAPNTITANASDDKGIKHVVFSTGERTLCTDTTAPYTCDYVPTAADVGRDTIVAIAVDTADQTASAVRTVSVPRFKATALSAATSPKRDRRAPYAFTTKGKLALPAGVAPAAGCKGTIDVSFKAGKKTVSSRRVALKPDCTYSSKVTFRLPRRLNPRTLSVVTVFGGNDVVEAISGKRHTVRPR